MGVQFEGAEESVEFAGDGDVGGEVCVGGEDEAEVEGVGVAWVGRVFDTLWVGEDAVVGDCELEGAVVAESGVGD